MNDTDLYQLLLGLEEPWEVERVEVDVSRSTVFVDVKCAKKNWVSESGDRLRVQGYRQKQWRHLDTCHLRTVVRARVPRVRYPDGHTEMVDVSWAEQGNRFTQMFEAACVRTLARAPTTDAAANHLGVTWDETRGVMERAVRRGLERRDLSHVENIGVAFHRYRPKGARGRTKDARGGVAAVTYVTDEGSRGTPQVLAVGFGKEGEAAQESLESFREARKRAPGRIQSVDVGFAKQVTGAVEAVFPSAVSIHDRFHVSRAVAEVLETVRERERVGVQGQPGGAFRYGHEREANESGTETGQSWVLRESVSRVWDVADPEEQISRFDACVDWAAKSLTREIRKVGRLLRKGSPGVRSAIRLGIDGGATERLGNAVEGLRASGRRSGSEDSFRNRLLFRFGKIDGAPRVRAPRREGVPERFWEMARIPNEQRIPQGWRENDEL